MSIIRDGFYGSSLIKQTYVFVPFRYFADYDKKMNISAVNVK
ncbi:MAG: hypothetical protein PHG58_03460 [Clostridia bacterium]|nr:hypothetical protein [Clostridia bacterium]